MSIHKAQGISRKKLTAYLGTENKSALEGLAYVALSRVTEAAGLIVLHIIKEAFKVSAKVKSEYARLALLQQAGTVSNVLGNAVIHSTPEEVEKRKNKRIELSLLSQFENENSGKKTSTTKKSTEKKKASTKKASTKKKKASTKKTSTDKTTGKGTSAKRKTSSNSTETVPFPHTLNYLNTSILFCDVFISNNPNKP
jgi:hypothetical protein